MAKKLSLPELRELVQSIVTAAKISNSSFVETRDNVVGLIDKIGKIMTIDSVFNIDKLNKFDGEYLSYGKTVEEWQQDLTLPQNYDPTGANALAPHDGTYRPVFYSYTIGRKVIPVTLRNNNIERAVHNEGEYIDVVTMQTKRGQDSKAQYRYQVKKEMLAKLIALCEGEMDPTNATLFVAATAVSTVNTLLKNASNAVGILVKPYPSNGAADWAGAIAAGYIVPLDLVTEIAKPVDTSTGEAFVKQVKADLEAASDVSEGHSLNGNTLGAVEGLTLTVRQGVIPALEVDTYAGAFNRSDLAMPAEIVVVNDMGSASNDVFAVLMDNRGMRLFPTYDAVRNNANGAGDFENIYYHMEDTAHISRNTFVKVYKVPQA